MMDFKSRSDVRDPETLRLLYMALSENRLPPPDEPLPPLIAKLKDVRNDTQNWDHRSLIHMVVS